jgi:enterochelin esterase-like enzyme
MNPAALAPRSLALHSPRLESFRRAARRGGQRGVDHAWQELVRGGVPLVEPVPRHADEALLTFVWRPERPARAATVLTTVSAPTREGLEMAEVPGTGVWFRTFRLSRKVRAYYSFADRPYPGAEDSGAACGDFYTSLRTDPLNPRRLVLPAHPDDPELTETIHSLVELPGAPPEPWSRANGSPAFVEHAHRLRSRVLHNERSVWVELPTSYEPSRRPYNLLVVFDGPIYRSTIPSPTIVGNLVGAGRIGPTVLVLVTTASGARESELGNNPKFAEFLARELLPWLRREYGLSVPARRTVLAGSSLGGLAAAYAALRYPDRFGNVLAQSGAFAFPFPRADRSRATLAGEFARSRRRPVRFYLEAGNLEWTGVPPGGDTSLLGSVRTMRDVLIARGYSVDYTEFDGGHDYACWRETFPRGVLSLLGSGRARAPRPRP